MRRKIYTNNIKNLIIPLESFQHEKKDINNIEMKKFKEKLGIYCINLFDFSEDDKIIDFKLVNSIISYKSKNITKNIHYVVDIGYYSNFLNFFDFEKYMFKYIKNIKYLCIGKTSDFNINNKIKELFLINNYDVIDDVHHAYNNEVYYIIKN